MHEKRPDDQTWLMDGLGYMVTRPDYHEYLKETHHPLEVIDLLRTAMYTIIDIDNQRSGCNNHQAVNQANAGRGKLEATGIGGSACAQHGCFFPHSVVDFQKGEK